ncbi:MAG: hypothetical protein SWK76_03775 [Actinomycetota bacterium]|nr:hypothetical protein [Actinomycetota bacterium]
MPDSAKKAIFKPLFLIMFSLAPFIWKKLEAYCSRVFFSSLHDAAQLKELVSINILQSSPDPFESLPIILRELIIPLGLDRLGILAPPVTITEHGLLFQCRRADMRDTEIDLIREPHITYNVDRVKDALVSEELQRWPRHNRDKALGDELASAGIHARVPIMTSSQILGHFLTGEK